MVLNPKRTGKHGGRNAKIAAATPEELLAGADLNPEARALAAIMAASDGDNAESVFTVSVVERPDRKKNETEEKWLFDSSVDELPALRRKLLEIYGGGSYRVRVRKDDVLFQAWDVTIKAPANYIPPAQMKPAATSELSALTTALMTFMERQEQRMTALAEKIAAPPSAGPMAALKDTLAVLADYTKLMPKAEAAAPAADSLAMFEKGMAFAERIAGASASAAGETGLLDIVREVIRSPMAQQLARSVMAGVAPQQPAPQQRTGPPGPPMRPMAAVAAPGQDGGGQRVADVIAYLVGQAAAGAQPNLFTDYVLENVPGALLDQIENMPDAAEALAARFPTTAPYRPWFEALLLTLYEEASPKGEPNARPDNPAAPDRADT